MKKCFSYFSFSIILSLLFVSNLSGQEQTPRCGTTIEDQAILGERLRYNRAHPSPELRTGGAIYIPMIFHLVGKKDGSGRFDRLDKVLDAICKLNHDYGPQGMVFYLEGVTESIKELNHTASWDNPKGQFSGIKLTNTAHNSSNGYAVNIFVVNDIKDGNNPGEILGFYSPQGDYVVMKSKEIKSPSSTFAHELGHFFSLMHPFYGWEGRSYNYNSPTPTSIFYAGRQILVEYVSRTKKQGNNKLCEVAADQLCDTEANYKLGFGYSGCDWTGKAKDPDNEMLHPQERNFMAYFLNCNNYSFTDEQGAAMQRDYNSNQRAFLRQHTVPNLGEPGETTPTFPENNQTLDYYDVVTLDWTDAPEATHYLVERATRSAFSTGYTSFIVDKSEITMTDLAKRKTYYWKVTPLNDTHLCGSATKTQKFKTGSKMYTATKDLNGVQDWYIVQGNDSDHPTHIILNTTQSWKGQVKLLSPAGIVLSTQNVEIAQGRHILPIKTNLAQGLYLVSLKGENGGIDTKKLLISN